MRGHVYRKRRPDGSLAKRWHAVFDLPPGPDGKRRQKTTTHDTKREAEAALNEALQKVRQGQYIDTDLTVAQFLDDWLAARAQLRPSTVRSYEAHVRLHLRPHLGRLRLRDLRPVHVELAYRSIRESTKGSEREVGPSTMRRIHATLNSALNTAVKKRMLTYNPAQHVELPEAPRHVASVWTAAELSQFLTIHADDRLTPFVQLIAYRGLRRGEALGLRWTDVDLDVGSLHVVQQIVQLGHATVIGPPKTRKGVRTVTLDQATVASLRRHRARQSADRLSWGSLWQDTGLVFTAEHGLGLHPAYVTKRFGAMVRAAGMPAIRLHDLRHTSASLGLASGESLKEVSDRLGHSSIAITADIYTHVTPALARGSAENLAALVAESSLGNR